MAEALEVLLDELVEEARLHLPEHARYLGFDGQGDVPGFVFTVRTKGEVMMHRTCMPLLTLLRRGFTEHAYERIRIVAADANDDEIEWAPWCGVLSAPDGTFVKYETYPMDGEDPLTEYGVINRGAFGRLFGKAWSGGRSRCERWDTPPSPIRIRGADVWVGPREKKYPTFYLAFNVTSRSVFEVANKLNEILLERSQLYKSKPSPGYYDESRWSRNDNEWSFE